MDQLLLTPEHASELLAVGRTKLYELLRTGVLESVRIGTADASPPPHSPPTSSNSAKMRQSTPTATTTRWCPDVTRRGRGEGSIYRRDDGTAPHSTAHRVSGVCVTRRSDQRQFANGSSEATAEPSDHRLRWPRARKSPHK